MKNILKLCIVPLIAFSTFTGYVEGAGVGFVNVKKSIEKSKFGKKERTAFEGLKKQLTESLEKSDKELNDMAKKLEDQEFLEGLSTQAADDLKQKFQRLSQEFVRNQNQFYQLLNQANMKMLQNLNDIMCREADKLRQNKKLDFILNDDVAFSYDPAFDVTDELVRYLDASFDEENKGVTLSP